MARGAENVTKWVGSTASVLLHTLLFAVSFMLPYLDLVSFDRMLLVLTTIVSLEAIYLSIFIQISLNMNNQNIEIIQEEIEEISEDIDEIGEDIEEIQKDVDEIGEDIEEIGEDIEEIQKDVDEIQEDVDEIQKDVDEMHDDDDAGGIATTHSTSQGKPAKESDILASIQATLAHLQREIEQLKKDR